ncbi:hypothetical protein VT99_10854 [Candidatus Electrothrix marina]|uniref:Uncharacterized protein n=1 Tax=Candidatus Electrothrix marina TaxID=1859130 RepID=A0A3S3QIS7_9BACT|nr:hypothetical protein VT99_10854 [Candidatus Electrothrix marina]
MALRRLVGNSMFRKYSEPEIFKISVSKSSPNNVSYAVIESFNKIVQNFGYQLKPGQKVNSMGYS